MPPPWSASFAGSLASVASTAHTFSYLRSPSYNRTTCLLSTEAFEPHWALPATLFETHFLTAAGGQDTGGQSPPHSLTVGLNVIAGAKCPGLLITS